MSNDTTGGRLWVLDTPGVITTKAIYVRKLVLVPNATGDIANFVYWNEGKTDDVVTAASKSGVTGTITSAKTMTSAGNVPATAAAGYVFQIQQTTGYTANLGYHVITSAGDGDALTVSPADWTNEASKVYTWKVMKTYPALYLPAGSSDTSPVMLDFGCHSFRLPNLVLKSLSTSAKVYLYIDWE
jgi:uncharacterized membrane protein